MERLKGDGRGGAGPPHRPEAEKLALVTGATGFTGGHLARALVRRNYRVRALVRDRAKAGALERAGIEPIEGDLTRPGDVDAAVRGCSHVYHIAALYRDARFPDAVYHDVNVNGTRHVLEAAAKHRVERVVHCSTVGVHGDIGRLPADEDAPFDPGDVYQETKLQGELAAREAFAGGLPGAIVRPAGIYGPGDLRFLKLFKGIHRGTFRVFGSGEVVYHLTYIDDLVEGILLCGEHPRALGETFILVGPRYTTINELVDRVAAAVGAAAPRVRLPLKPLLAAAWLCEAACRPLGLEPPLHRRRCDFFRKSRAFSTEKARRLLGYTPRVDLNEGLRATATWYFAEGYLSRRSPAAVAVPADGGGARRRDGGTS